MESPEGEQASPEKAEQAVRSMTDEQHLRFEHLAKTLVYRYPSINPNELLDEAVMRILGKQRITWPHGVPFEVYFYNVMRSIADDLRADERRILGFSTLDELDVVEARNRDAHDATERAAIDLQWVNSVWQLFKDDPRVQNLLLGTTEELSAKEIQAQFQMTAAEYDAARKRLDRGLRKRYPKGFES